MITQSDVGSFLLQFQEPHIEVEDPSAAYRTQTRTLTREEPDQDPQRGAAIVCGTQTGTKTLEGPDQDPRLLSTQTYTAATETRDQEQQVSDYFAIPRS